MIDRPELLRRFHERFHHPADLFARAPGRVNLIGEHTDYNGGLVMPAAINREMALAARLRPDSRVLRLASENFPGEVFEARLDLPVQPLARVSWPSYFLAMVSQFQQRGFSVPGMDVLLWGDVPLGAGLSSSAAYEVCVGFFLAQVLEASLAPSKIAQMAQAAEHSPFVGVQCGIMDQFISAVGHRDHALWLNCHTLEHHHAPFDSSRAALLIINSLKSRELAGSAYNTRRRECEEALQTLSALTGIRFPTLSHVPLDLFRQHEAALPPVPRQRARHVLTENARVEALAGALAANKLPFAGELFYQSHESLQKDYEVSCEELDAIVDSARQARGIYGCRMTGAGFGGCAVALVAKGQEQQAADRIQRDYQARFAVTPLFYLSEPAQGAECVWCMKQTNLPELIS